MDFDLRLLTHARALAEEGSFARAARTLHITQPALSRSIQELERRAGILLFKRTHAQVELTDLGRIFMAHAREVLARAELLDRETAMLRGTGTGRIVVGCGTYPAAMFMPDALLAFLQRHPRVGVEVVKNPWLVLLAALRHRDLDFVVATPPPEETADLAIRVLSTWQPRFLVRRGHPLIGLPDAGLAEIGAYPLISTARLTREVTEGFLSSRRADDARMPIPSIACESHEMMCDIARNTDHVLISSPAAQRKAMAAGELVALPFVDPRMLVSFAILRLKSRELPPIAEDLVEAVIAADAAAHRAEPLLMQPLPVARAAGTTATRRSTPRTKAAALR